VRVAERPDLLHCTPASPILLGALFCLARIPQFSNGFKQTTFSAAKDSRIF